MRQRQEPYKECQGTVCGKNPGPRDKQYKQFCCKCGQRMRNIDYQSVHGLREEMRSIGVPLLGHNENGSPK